MVQYSNATPSASTVSVCANKSTGALRLLATGKKCRASEKKVTWNAQGLQGIQGEPGIQGIQGIQGMPGVNGQDGQDGTDGGKGGLWINASSFTLTSGDADHAFLGVGYLNGWPTPGFVFKDRALNTGFDDIETRFAIPATWAGVTHINVTYYYSAKSGSGNIQLWKGMQGFSAGAAMGGLGWNNLHFGPVNGAGTLEYDRFTLDLNNASVYGLGVERNSDTTNTPDTNTDDVVFFGAMVEPVLP